MDSNRKSLKVLLLDNTAALRPLIVIGYSASLKESSTNFEAILKLVDYEKHQWFICSDCKVLCMLAGIKGGNADYPCFLCSFYANKKGISDHYVIRDWGPKSESVRQKAKKGEQLVPLDKLLFPPLHIQLGLVKIFLQTLDQDGEAWECVEKRFPKMNSKLPYRGSLNGKDIQMLFKDNEFEEKLPKNHQVAWAAFREVSWNFLGTYKVKKYITLRDF